MQELRVFFFIGIDHLGHIIQSLVVLEETTRQAFRLVQLEQLPPQLGIIPTKTTKLTDTLVRTKPTSAPMNTAKVHRTQQIILRTLQQAHCLRVTVLQQQTLLTNPNAITLLQAIQSLQLVTSYADILYNVITILKIPPLYHLRIGDNLHSL